jgi:putative transposase
MDANIALAHLAAGRACHSGAEYRCGVHEDSPLLALLGSMPRRTIAGPHFVTSEPYHGLVQSYRDGRFYLYATIDVPEDAPIQPTRFLGVDLGIANLLTDSDGHTEPGETIERTRQRRQTARNTYQARGTKSAKRRLRKMAGRQQRFQRWVNHGLAKRLVQHAKDTQAILVLEDLTHIRRRLTVRKRQRAKHANWSFRQLRAFIFYKATQAGVPWLLVDPRYTSQTCSRCGFRDQRNRRSQAEFSCLKCGYHSHADVNAAINLAGRAFVSAPDLIAPVRGQLALSWQ